MMICNIYWSSGIPRMKSRATLGGAPSHAAQMKKNPGCSYPLSRRRRSNRAKRSCLSSLGRNPDLDKSEPPPISTNMVFVAHLNTTIFSIKS